MKKLLNALTPLVMAAVFLTTYLVVFRHVLLFHEQHHLFLFSWPYIQLTLSEHGLWWLMAEFVVQFSYWPWLGAAVWTALLLATYCLTRGAIRRLTGLPDRLQLSALLPVWMFFETVNVDTFPERSMMAFTIVVGVWIVSVVAGRFIPKRWNVDPESKAARIWALCGPLIFAAVFAAGNQHFYRGRTLTLPSGKERAFTSEEIREQRRLEGIMMKADQAMRRGDWPTVTTLCNEAALSGRPNHLLDYFRSIALYNQGLLIDHLFDYPQRFGERALYYPWKADKNQAEYGGYVYEQLGALNSAIHWEFEALVGWGETARHLINLSKYYIEAGKPLQADKFIAPLRKSLFYRGEAKRLTELRAVGDVPGVRDALKSAPTSPGRWDAVVSLADDLTYIVYNDPTNRMAAEYLLMISLLRNEIGRFYAVLQRFFPPEQANASRLIQQALCLVRINYGPERLAQDGYVISPEVEADFRDYLSRHARGKGAQYTQKQRQSIWYYVHYVSPHGRELIF